jgi:hypothetical protein
MRKTSSPVYLPWITAGLGLAVVVLNFINSSMFYAFLKKQPVELDHAYMPHFPAEELLSLIGFVLFFGGIIIGIKQLKVKAAGLSHGDS